MNLVDLGVVALGGLSGFRGWRVGFLGQVFEFGGGFLGLIAGIALGPNVANVFTETAGVEGALISLLTVFVCMSIGQTIGHILGHRGGVMAHRAKLGGLNSGLGAGFGVFVTVISFWLIGSLLVHGPIRGVARAFKGSKILDVTSAVFPQPPDVLAYFRQYLSTSGFPQVFAGLPPAFGPPVDLPSGRLERRAVQAAQESTVQIRVPACGGIQLGSGWVAAPNTVVTNAHVVSGGSSLTVNEINGDEHVGRVVTFDPRTDVAVIHVEGLDGPPLALEVDPLDRGTPGATLGFPGEARGQLIHHRAAIQNVYEDAQGKDIYGRRDVTRSVYALRSPVRQGDSGGPFVLPDGRVAGVVFAASTTDGGLGYALVGSEVADDIDRGAARTEPVPTGNCTH